MMNGAAYPGSQATGNIYDILKVQWQGAQPLTLERANGGMTEFRYDAGGRPIEVLHLPQAGMALRLCWLYDGLGNVMLTQEALGNVTKTTRYRYDGRDQLVAWGASTPVVLPLSDIAPRSQPPAAATAIQAAIDAIVSGAAWTEDVTYGMTLAAIG